MAPLGPMLDCAGADMQLVTMPDNVHQTQYDLLLQAFLQTYVWPANAVADLLWFAITQLAVANW